MRARRPAGRVQTGLAAALPQSSQSSSEERTFVVDTTCRERARTLVDQSPAAWTSGWPQLRSRFLRSYTIAAKPHRGAADGSGSPASSALSRGVKTTIWLLY